MWLFYYPLGFCLETPVAHSLIFFSRWKIFCGQWEGHQWFTATFKDSDGSGDEVLHVRQ